MTSSTILEELYEPDSTAKQSLLYELWPHHQKLLKCPGLHTVARIIGVGVGSVELTSSPVMVLLSAVTWVRAAKPDKFWRHRKIFRLSAHYQGRARNCYKIAIVRVQKALLHATRGRSQKKKDVTQMWEQRLTAGCQEHGTTLAVLREGLMRCNVLLNRKVLSDLAIWEPRTFKSVVDMCKAKVAQDRPRGLAHVPDRPDHVITRGML